MNLIKKIVLTIGDKEISLTINQAKDLRTALNDLFGHDIIKVVEIDRVVVPYYPIQPHKWDYPTVTYCIANSSNVSAKYSPQQETLNMYVKEK